MKPSSPQHVIVAKKKTFDVRMASSYSEDFIANHEENNTTITITTPKPHRLIMLQRREVGRNTGRIRVECSSKGREAIFLQSSPLYGVDTKWPNAMDSSLQRSLWSVAKKKMARKANGVFTLDDIATQLRTVMNSTVLNRQAYPRAR